MAALMLDENVSRGTGQALADAGHDVAFVADLEPGAADGRVLALAREQRRILVTFDSDYGELVFKQGCLAPTAIVYLRVHPIATATAAALARQALDTDPAGFFIVATPEGLRRRALPVARDDDGRA